MITRYNDRYEYITAIAVFHNQQKNKTSFSNNVTQSRLFWKLTNDR